MGQIGMRIMQRPKSDTLFKDEKAKADFMNKMFIENVWCFGPKEDYYLNNSSLTRYYCGYFIKEELQGRNCFLH